MSPSNQLLEPTAGRCTKKVEGLRKLAAASGGSGNIIEEGSRSKFGCKESKPKQRKEPF